MLDVGLVDGTALIMSSVVLFSHACANMVWCIVDSIPLRLIKPCKQFFDTNNHFASAKRRCIKLLISNFSVADRVCKHLQTLVTNLIGRESFGY